MDKDKQEKLKEFCRKLAPVAGAALGEMVRQEMRQKPVVPSKLKHAV